MSRLSQISLKVKLIGVTLLTGALLGGVSLAILNHIVGEQEEAHKSIYQAQAKTLSDAIGAQFYERYGDVQAFAMNPNIRANSRSKIVEVLNQYAALYGIYDLIMVVAANGKLVAVNDKNPAGKDINVKELYETDFSSRPWFSDTLAGKFSEDKEKGFAGTFVESFQKDTDVSAVFGEPRYGTSFSAQIKDESGKVIGVVTNRAGSRWFEVAFQEVYEGLKSSGYSHAQLMLMGLNGESFLHFMPSANGNKIDAVYDAEKTFKTHALFNAFSKKLSQEESGGLFADDPSSGEQVVLGYDRTNVKKILDSLGWIVAVADPYNEALGNLIAAKRIFYGVFSVIFILSILGASLFASKVAASLASYAGDLLQGSKDLAETAEAAKSSSVQLSSAATEQAAAIQQTAASIDEVSAMVKKNSENSQQSRTVSNKARNTTEQGQKAVSDMIHSIEAISLSNEHIMKQVDEGNKQISEIVKVIAEIGAKTKVINDIVFQTKLLSFNASVEAARAGEHGKGFAVVAEEVGNLAQMSGNAAKEISDMLEQSIKRVDDIVKSTKENVEKMVVEAKSKIESGTSVAKRCGDLINETSGFVGDVDTMVSEIATASSEQSQGVNEITKAIGQLNQVTQQNSASANESAQTSEKLRENAKKVAAIVADLNGLVHGKADVNHGHFEDPASFGGSSFGATASAGHGASASVLSMAEAKMKKSNTSALSRPVNVTKNVAAPANHYEVAATGTDGDVPSAHDSRFEDV